MSAQTKVKTVFQAGYHSSTGWRVYAFGASMVEARKNLAARVDEVALEMTIDTLIRMAAEKKTLYVADVIKPKEIAPFLERNKRSLKEGYQYSEDSFEDTNGEISL